MDKTRILFLCTGNSCRSQMAEALLRHHAGDWYEAYSAGTDPRPVHPLTLKVLQERGVSTAGLYSKGVDELLGQVLFGYVITVCDQAAESCPLVWPGAYEILHWSFPDPAAYQGTEFGRLTQFREVRDMIEDEIRVFCSRLRLERTLPLIAPYSRAERIASRV